MAALRDPPFIVINEHPYAVRVWERLTSRGVARPLPRDYGVWVISEALHAADHIRLLEATQQNQETET